VNFGVEMATSPPLVDFGKAAEDYARHRKSFPTSLMDRLTAFGIGQPGDRIVDLGSGTGLFGLEFARRGCSLIGVDPSKRLLEKARESAGQEALDAQFLEGTAEETGLEASSAEAVVCATAWHWFERERAAREALRLLKPGGHLAITVLGWHFLPGNIATRTMDLIREFAPKPERITLSTLQYPEWSHDLIAAGFQKWEMFGYIEPVAYSHEDWRGRVRASQGIGPVLSPEHLARFDAAMAEMLAREFPENPYPVEHRIEALVAWR
jgi:SAM-dependent methyltransferase